MEPRVSWIILVRDSHECVRRQIIYMNKLFLPSWLEVVFCDDHSDPPITFKNEPNFRCRLVVHEKPGDWNISSGFNFAASYARGEFYMFTGIDHMICDEWINWAEDADYDWMGFQREVAVLDEHGNIIDFNIRMGSSSCNWIRASTFWELNGFDTKFDGGRYHCDLDLGRRWGDLRGLKKIREYVTPDEVFFYMFPDRQDPLRPDRLFHNVPTT
jgi:hypothetical protein